MNDNTKIAVAVTVFLVGVLGYYFLGPQGFLARTGSLVLGALLGGGVYYTTNQFGRFRQFVREARAEINRVVWPTRQETVQTTAIVIGMVLFVGVFLWIVDWIIFSAVRMVMG